MGFTIAVYARSTKLCLSFDLVCVLCVMTYSEVCGSYGLVGTGVKVSLGIILI